MSNSRIFNMKISDIYPLLVQKVQRKGRTKAEVDTVICWLTGYDESGLESQLNATSSLEVFFSSAPQFNPNADSITGLICGHRVENITDPLLKKIRQLDKLVDELAKGKAMEKILRNNVALALDKT